TVGQSVRMYHLQLHRLIRCEAGARDHGRVTGLVIAFVGGYRSYSGECRGLHVAGRVAANGCEQLRPGGIGRVGRPRELEATVRSDDHSGWFMAHSWFGRAVRVGHLHGDDLAGNEVAADGGYELARHVRGTIGTNRGCLGRRQRPLEGGVRKKSGYEKSTAHERHESSGRNGTGMAGAVYDAGASPQPEI